MQMQMQTAHTSYRSPFVDLGPDLFRLILTHLAGESLDGPISTNAYRCLLPFAVCCKNHYNITMDTIRGLTLLPLHFNHPKNPARRPAPSFPLALLQPRTSQSNSNSNSNSNTNVTSSTSMLPSSPRQQHHHQHHHQQQQLEEQQHHQEQQQQSPSTRTSATSFRFASLPALSTHLPPAIARLTSLRTLHLFRNSEVDDAALTQIAQNAPLLRELRLRACRTLTVNALRALTVCRHLHLLDLSYSHNFGDDTAPILAALPALHTLLIAHWPVSDIFVAALVHSRTLQVLNLNACTQLTTDSCRAIAGNHRIHTLHFQSSLLNDDGLRALAQSTALVSLDLTLCRLVSNSGIAALCNLHNLQTLNLAHCKLLTDEGISKLATIRTLRSVDLSFCHLLTDASAFVLSQLPYIEAVHLSTCVNISDDGVAMLTALPWLRKLSLSQCIALTDEAALSIRDAANAPLQFVDLRKCSAISESALAEVQMACKVLLQSHEE